MPLNCEQRNYGGEKEVEKEKEDEAGVEVLLVEYEAKSLFWQVDD